MGLILTLATASSAIAASAGASAGASSAAPPPAVCAEEGPAYYAFELSTTRNVVGTGLARGSAEISVPQTSPFAVDLSADGSYVYDVRVSLRGMRKPTGGHLVAWVTTTELDRVHRIGTLDADLQAVGSVQWNKFLVVITLESTEDAGATAWSGPIAFRGMSRSGMMHTMAGHGAFEQENCATYGYGS